MRHNVNKVKSSVYKTWINGHSAQLLCALEAAWLKQYLAKLQGQQLLFAGIDLAPVFIHKLLRTHGFRMGLTWQRDCIDCHAYMQDNNWPLADCSVDIVVLQHALDFSQSPHQMLKEAARVLVPNGYLIIMGFNPHSVWGVVRAAKLFSSKLPWVLNPISVGRMRDWLTLVDMRVETVDMQAHIWPSCLLGEALSLRINNLLAKQNWLPASTYSCMARKTIAGVTPIREQRWYMLDNSFTTSVLANKQPVQQHMDNQQ